MSKELPHIEVNTTNMLNWMQERRMLPQDWLKKLQAVGQKIDELVQNFPYDHKDEGVQKVGKYLK
jgi:hypothetical protein